MMKRVEGEGDGGGSPGSKDGRAGPEGGFRVLLVDDEPLQLESGAALFAGEGWTVIPALGPQEARRRIEEAGADFFLAVLDVHMPDESGYELAEWIRSREATAALPIIFVTATHHDRVEVFQGYRTGAVDYLAKPVEGEVMRSKIRVFRDLRAQRNEIERQLREIRELQALLPICCNCKKIRDDQGYWHALEEYFMKNHGVFFSHGICPRCQEKLYPGRGRPS